MTVQGFRGRAARFEGDAGRRRRKPVLYAIAGFDPSSGAGFTADLKVFSAFGGYGVACPTAWTVQSTLGVRAVEAARPEMVRATLECLEADTPPDGVKVGMLANADVLRVVAGWLAWARAKWQQLPVVLDPVLAASSGRALLEPDAVEALREELLPLVTVATPNLEEAARLAGLDGGGGREAAEAAADRLLEWMGAGGAGVVVTGGTMDGAPADLVRTRDGGRRWLEGERVETTSTHGTGCAFSSALLCALVAGAGLEEAAAEAKRYVEGALRAAYPVGQGRGPLHHLYRAETQW